MIDIMGHVPSLCLPESRQGIAKAAAEMTIRKNSRQAMTESPFKGRASNRRQGSVPPDTKLKLHFCKDSPKALEFLQPSSRGFGSTALHTSNITEPRMGTWKPQCLYRTNKIA